MEAEFTDDCSAARSMAAIVLAAGLSRRMGDDNKLLLNYQGMSLLQRSVNALTAAGLGEIVVVLGHDNQRTLAELNTDNVLVVVNADYEQGQMSSVNCGLQALTGTKQGVMICLADQPLIEAQHLNELIDVFRQREAGCDIVLPMYQSQRGNPVVISEATRLKVLNQEQSIGCRRFIDSHPELVQKVEMQSAAFVIDIDTQEEYLELLGSQPVPTGSGHGSV